MQYFNDGIVIDDGTKIWQRHRRFDFDNESMFSQWRRTLVC